MPLSIFDHRDYKAYLAAWLAGRPGGGRGDKRRIAAALRCHTAYVTHVFRGHAHFSLEQALDFCALAGHTAEEENFFVLLVQLARAGNQSSKVYLNREIQKLLDARLNLKTRLKFKRKLEPLDQSVFYSAWYYSAIYALVSVPGFQSAEKIAESFRLPVPKVSEVLAFLLSRGLLKLKNGNYEMGTTSIHLEKDSTMIAKHHTNWRLRAVESLDHPDSQDLHYSSVISVSKKDLPQIKSLLITAIENIRSIVAQSAEDSVYSYSVDLFSLSREPSVIKVR